MSGYLTAAETLRMVAIANYVNALGGNNAAVVLQRKKLAAHRPVDMNASKEVRRLHVSDMLDYEDFEASIGNSWSDSLQYWLIHKIDDEPLKALLQLADGSTIEIEPSEFEKMTLEVFCQEEPITLRAKGTDTTFAGSIAFDRGDVEAEIAERFPPARGQKHQVGIALAPLPNGEERQPSKARLFEAAMGSKPGSLVLPDEPDTDAFLTFISIDTPPVDETEVVPVLLPSPPATPEGVQAPPTVKAKNGKTRGPKPHKSNNYQDAVWFTLTELLKLGERPESAVQLRKKTNDWLSLIDRDVLEADKSEKYLNDTGSQDIIADKIYDIYLELQQNDAVARRKLKIK